LCCSTSTRSCPMTSSLSKSQTVVTNSSKTVVTTTPKKKSGTGKTSKVSKSDNPEEVPKFKSLKKTRKGKNAPDTVEQNSTPLRVRRASTKKLNSKSKPMSKSEFPLELELDPKLLESKSKPTLSSKSNPKLTKSRSNSELNRTREFKPKLVPVSELKRVELEPVEKKSELVDFKPESKLPSKLKLERKESKWKKLLKSSSKSKLPKRVKTSSESSKSKLTRDHDLSTKTDINAEYLGPDVIRAPIALEAAKTELERIPKDGTIFRDDAEVEVRTICAFWNEQEAEYNSAFQQGLITVFKESVGTMTKLFLFNTNTGAPEVDRHDLKPEEMQKLLSGIKNVFDYIFFNAEKVLSPGSRELLKDVAKMIKDKDNYPNIDAKTSSVLFLKILIPAINKYAGVAFASSIKERTAIIYVQQVLQSFANDPTNPVQKSNLSETNLGLLNELMQGLNARLDVFMSELLGDLSVPNT
jgi:hypothetical protein